MFTKLVLNFEILTPLFMGNADQMAELRPPAFKGLLRHWYRAICPQGIDKEAEIFGGAGQHQGQAPFFLNIDPVTTKTRTSLEFEIKQGGTRYPGLSYLGYTFPLQNTNRKKEGRPIRNGIESETRFNLSLLFPRDPNADMRKRILAAAWLLGHVGCGGSRSKRGFGAFALTDWKVEKADDGSPVQWAEMEELTLLSNLPSAEQWQKDFLKTLALFQSKAWFDETRGKICHPHFGEAYSLYFGKRSFKKNDWASCLNDMGVKMQTFRLKYPKDYEMVKSRFHGRAGLERTPDRAAFGLPLAFRYGRENGPEFLPKSGDRHASLLLLRPVLVNGTLHPLYLKLAGAVPGGILPEDQGNRYSGSRIKKTNLSYPPFPDTVNAMDAFLEYIKTQDLKGGITNG